MFLVDDHPVVRRGLSALIDQEPGLEVCGQAFDESGALEALELTNPDLVIVDLSLGSRSGIGLIKTMRNRFPDILILVLTLQDTAFFAERAFRAGARGYLTKREAGDMLVPAIRELLRGEIYISAPLSGKLLRRLLARGRDVGGPAARLSQRERQVFALLGQGLGTRRIAAELELSRKTIETHRANIMGKLDLRDSSELWRAAGRWAASHDDG